MNTKKIINARKKMITKSYSTGSINKKIINDIEKIKGKFYYLPNLPQPYNNNLPKPYNNKDNNYSYINNYYRFINPHYHSYYSYSLM
tara:strand:+ start:144 stop:404 length:261 start_codon:yes stop_codon:yes gene_type:complete